jgi:hypothetical protein
MTDEPRKWSAPPKHVLELSYGHGVTNYYHLKRETPKPANNLTPSEHRPYIPQVAERISA